VVCGVSYSVSLILYQSIKISYRCLFGELLLSQPLFPGNTEIGQLELIYTLCGTPTGDTADFLSRYDGWNKMKIEKQYPNTISRKFSRFSLIIIEYVNVTPCLVWMTQHWIFYSVF
jgi:hypothetical protein